MNEDPAWTLREAGPPAERARVVESLFALGAGGFVTRGAAEEDGPGSVPLTLADGVYTGAGAQQHLLPGPSWTGLDLEPPGDDVRVLDMRAGVLRRSARTPAGAPLRTVRLASAAHPGLVAMRAEGPAETLRAGAPLRPPADPGVRFTEGTTDDLRWAQVDGEGTDAAIGAVAVQHERLHDGVRVIERFACYVADPDGRLRMDEAAAAVRAAASLGFDEILARHQAVWAQRWADVDIGIPDDPDAERAIRFALFQLWCNVNRHDESAVGARGLSGTGYSGHVFWDAEVFVLPAVVTMDPEAAAAMVRYRLHRLQAAHEAARAVGRRGARFPWESAATGHDVTPTEGFLGGERVPIRTGELEEHVTADVAWAAHHVARWTGGPQPTEGDWRPLVVETARYWAARCDTDVGGRAHIDGVIGPDEYHEAVDDNAYTNVMARWNLRTAAQLPGVDEQERAAWLDLADRIVDGYNPATGRYEQFAGYHRLEPMHAADLGEPPLAADVLLGQDRLAATQLIKQPDVLMLHHLVPEEVAPGSLPPNLDWYIPRTTHGSSLSPAITAALLARGGRPEEGLRLLCTGMTLDFADLTGSTGAGLHLATIGGVWQAVLTGFAGVRVQENLLAIDPCLPAAWGSLQLRFRCLGRRVRLQLSPDDMVVETDGPLRVQPAGQPARTISGAARVPWASSRRRAA